MCGNVLHVNKDGSITIVERDSGSLAHGTELIRGLVDGKTSAGKDFDMIITNDTRGTTVNTKINAETFANVKESASNGNGTGSKIVISPELDKFLPMQDNTKEKVPYNIALGHELIHSDNNRNGVRNMNEIVPYDRKIKNIEELKTIKRENILRSQQNLNIRYYGNFE